MINISESFCGWRLCDNKHNVTSIKYKFKQENLNCFDMLLIKNVF